MLDEGVKCGVPVAVRGKRHLLFIPATKCKLEWSYEKILVIFLFASCVSQLL